MKLKYGRYVVLWPGHAAERLAKIKREPFKEYGEWYVVAELGPEHGRDIHGALHCVRLLKELVTVL